MKISHESPVVIEYSKEEIEKNHSHAATICVKRSDGKEARFFISLFYFHGRLKCRATSLGKTEEQDVSQVLTGKFVEYE